MVLSTRVRCPGLGVGQQLENALGAITSSMLLRRGSPAVLHGWRRASSTAAPDQFQYNPRNVVRVLHRVQEILGAKVQFPRIVMVGTRRVSHRVSSALT